MIKISSITSTLLIVLMAGSVSAQQKFKYIPMRKAPNVQQQPTKQPAVKLHIPFRGIPMNPGQNAGINPGGLLAPGTNFSQGNNTLKDPGQPQQPNDGNIGDGSVNWVPNFNGQFAPTPNQSNSGVLWRPNFGSQHLPNQNVNNGTLQKPDFGHIQPPGTWHSNNGAIKNPPGWNNQWNNQPLQPGDFASPTDGVGPLTQDGTAPPFQTGPNLPQNQNPNINNAATTAFRDLAVSIRLETYNVSQFGDLLSPLVTVTNKGNVASSPTWLQLRSSVSNGHVSELRYNSKYDVQSIGPNQTVQFRGRYIKKPKHYRDLRYPTNLFLYVVVGRDGKHVGRPEANTANNSTKLKLKTLSADDWTIVP